MRFLVFGAGAMGSLIGGLLSIENEVSMVARASHAEAINERGLRITGKTELTARPRAMTNVSAERVDVVVVTTKSYDTSFAVSQLHAHAQRATFVTLQNGLGNAEAIASVASRVAAGTTTHGVTFVAPGEVFHAGVGDTVLGAFHGLTAREVEPIADVFSRAGLATSVVDDVRRSLWEKAIVNAAINPLSAILRVPNGALVASEDLRGLLRRVAAEGARAARAAGVEASSEGLADRAVEVATRTGANRSSMLQDIMGGRRTEAGEILGPLIEAGAEGGLPLPYLKLLRACVQGLSPMGNGLGRGR